MWNCRSLCKYHRNMSHTYEIEHPEENETIVFKEVQNTKNIPNTINEENQETFFNVYARSSTDAYEEPIESTRPVAVTQQVIEPAKRQLSLQSGEKSHKNSSEKQKTLTLTVVLVSAVGILAALGLFFGILNFIDTQNQNEEIYESTKPPFGTSLNPARSCVDLRDAGFKDGFYVIQPSLKSFEVYCDMIAAGGGWILASTVNNIMPESDDQSWFLTTNDNHQNNFNHQNWMNTNTFGTYENCTKSDFKSEAYFEYQGKDILLRHVPNQTPLEASREQSFLQYQTENSFMGYYGGNLHRIFDIYYPLKQTNGRTKVMR
uniref:Uncharacterized protein LOC100183062 n=1 Tax=Phallusia mammillata TaxID=59560 RepID=A0A6F9DHZ7_9ASCI|nr:uncharacterized protein LOC100183062 [Phallusia mammillata]